MRELWKSWLLSWQYSPCFTGWSTSNHKCVTVNMRYQCIKHHALSGLSRPSLQLICISLLSHIFIHVLCHLKTLREVASAHQCIQLALDGEEEAGDLFIIIMSSRVASSNSLSIKTTAKLLICYCHISLDVLYKDLILSQDHSDVSPSFLCSIRNIHLYKIKGRYFLEK